MANEAPAPAPDNTSADRETPRLRKVFLRRNARYLWWLLLTIVYAFDTIHVARQLTVTAPAIDTTAALAIWAGGTWLLLRYLARRVVRRHGRRRRRT